MADEQEEKRRGWGGHREGAGRPTITGSKMKLYRVTLPEEIAEQLRQLGGGNLSAGIREAARQLRESQPRGKA